jgi:hypothetical protein
MQNTCAVTTETAIHLRQGALVAVDLADRIRAIDEQLNHAPKRR